ncbi:MAG TPA: T9SS type A sorting domain-containing protein [Candidatus Cloacimonadota bacterium]|nr:T9SS type A sorting domain-containing protein [Candidatus Cloacimonadota bacterium]
MKALSSAVLLLTFCVSMMAITIETTHFGYQPGKIRHYRQGAWNQNSTDLTNGSGKSWNFSLPSPGYVHETYSAANNVPGFPNANICIAYDQLINGYGNSGYMYYQDNGSDLLQIGYTGSPNLVWSPPLPMGLPHYLGKTWQGTHSWTYGSYTVSGEVISEGTLTTPLGSFEAVCVRYHYSTSVISYDCYQWETRPYGLTAYSNTLNGGMLYVLETADPVSNYTDSQSTPIPELSLYPNPARNKATLELELLEDSPLCLKLFNLRGQVVQSWNYPSLRAGEQSLELELNRSVLAPGLYYLKAADSRDSFSKRLILY